MEDLKKIESEMMNEIREVNLDENTKGPIAGVASIPSPDFISDSTLLAVLRYKNKLIVAYFAKELGEAETKAIADLYEVTDEEKQLYKRILQKYIREYFPEHIDAISKITDSDEVALFIVEYSRAKSAKILRDLSLAKSLKEKEAK